MDLQTLSDFELDAVAADCDAKRQAWLAARDLAAAVSNEKARREQLAADVALANSLGADQVRRLAALHQTVAVEPVAQLAAVHKPG